MPALRRRLLILGGTGEAAALARLIAEALPGIEVISSLAGRTPPPDLPGRLRVGGFGGAAGLRSYIEAAGIGAVVDATHPFAAAISANARVACAAAGVPRLVLRRPEWRSQPGDRWIEAGDAAAAAALLPGLGRRAFLGIGAKESGAFAGLAGVWFLVRLAVPPPAPLPLADHRLIVARGPFTLDGERRLLAEHRIEVVVCKASGGSATEAKLTAAREMGLLVLMLRRPQPEPGAGVDSPSEAVAWVACRLGP